MITGVRILIFWSKNISEALLQGGKIDGRSAGKTFRQLLSFIWKGFSEKKIHFEKFLCPPISLTVGPLDKIMCILYFP